VLLAVEEVEAERVEPALSRAVGVGAASLAGWEVVGGVTVAVDEVERGSLVMPEVEVEGGGGEGTEKPG